MEYNEFDISRFGVHKLENYTDYISNIAKDITSICFGGETSFQTNNDQIVTYKKTTPEVPLTYKYDSIFKDTILYINEDVYNKDKESIKRIIIDTIKHNTNGRFSIFNPEFIDNDVIKALRDNKNIKEIELSYTKDYTLSKENFELLLENPSIEKISVANIDEEIRYQYNQKLNARNQKDICGLSLGDLLDKSYKSPSYWTIDRVYSQEELESLKKLVEQNKIEGLIVKVTEKSQLKEILSIMKDTQLWITASRDFTIEQYELMEQQGNVTMQFGGNNFTPTQCKNREKIIDLIIDEVKSHNLSPLEQYMYLYNVTKMFKDYKDNKDDPQQARTSEYTLDNNYMVCVGYATLLNELVEKLDNPNLKTSVISCTVNEEGHERLLAHIVDEKYGVDGVYSSDPTWDHVNYYAYERIDGEKVYDYNQEQATVDRYTHMLLSGEEIRNDRQKYELGVMDIILSDNPSEAIEKLEAAHKQYSIDAAVKSLQELYPDMNIQKDNIVDAVSAINNNKIEGETINECITNLYHVIYRDSTPEKQAELIDKTIYNNRVLQESYFPDNKEKYGKVA